MKNDSNIVYKQTSYEATMSKKPRYNAYQGGYGIHGDVKYSRNKEKQKLRRELEDY